MSSSRPTVKVELVPISVDRALALKNLLELYAHDFSEYVPLQLGADGRFDVLLGDEWWQADDHYPFFVHADGKLSGFALVRRGSRVTDDAKVMDIAEFFVVRGARRRGIGVEVVRELFRVLPGSWEARVRAGNAPAFAFWSRALAESAGQPPEVADFSKAGVAWQVFRAFAGPRA